MKFVFWYAIWFIASCILLGVGMDMQSNAVLIGSIGSMVCCIAAVIATPFVLLESEYEEKCKRNSKRIRDGLYGR